MRRDKKEESEFEHVGWWGGGQICLTNLKENKENNVICMTSFALPS